MTTKLTEPEQSVVYSDCALKKREAKMRVTVQRGQIPVGQGCFSFGRIRLNDTDGAASQFLYVHDCGGLQDLIAAGVQKYFAPNEPIDALYVSHFDEDHARGLEILLKSRLVHQVFVPVLDENIKLELLAAALATGALSASSRKLIDDPSGWFTDRGAANVIQVPSGLDNPERNERSLIVLNDPNRRTTFRTPVVDIAASVGGTATDFWRLKSFSAVNQDLAFLDKLNSHFKKQLGSDLPDVEAAKNWLLSGTIDSKDIKDFYQVEYSTDHNVVSLCLLSEPSPDLHTELTWTCFCETVIRRGFSESSGHGWLHTADYPFRNRKLLGDFLNYFQREMQRIGVFMLSHHGADLDFKEDLFDEAINTAMAVVPVGSKKQYGHPSDRALAALLLRRISPILVMDKSSDSFIVENEFDVI
jgi:hypothetical protein